MRPDAADEEIETLTLPAHARAGGLRRDDRPRAVPADRSPWSAISSIAFFLLVPFQLFRRRSAT